MKFKLEEIIVDQSNSIKLVARKQVVTGQHTVMTKFSIFYSVIFNDTP